MRRALVFLLIVWVLAGCAVVSPSSPPDKIVLLAPFEGRYREIGYSALYAARLAWTDSGAADITFLALDDGGSEQTALHRARALSLDERVRVVIVQGYAATTPEVFAALGDLPVIVVGDWGASPAPNVYHLSHAERDGLTVPERISFNDALNAPAPVVGGEVFALEGFIARRDDLDGVRVVSSGTPADADYIARIMASAPYAATPNHLSTLTYDAFRLAIDAVQTATPLDDMRHDGLNGVIRFRDGAWVDAPRHEYRFDDDGGLQRITP
ncbi:MAG: hypothetical protein EA396_14570 [Anaerolineaceae bacterium]|nr:MAG: hypothetical protein EA396_14570 [Anaerolineaceae bacterium]